MWTFLSCTRVALTMAGWKWSWERKTQLNSMGSSWKQSKPLSRAWGTISRVSGSWRHLHLISDVRDNRPSWTPCLLNLKGCNFPAIIHLLPFYGSSEIYEQLDICYVNYFYLYTYPGKCWNSIHYIGSSIKVLLGYFLNGLFYRQSSGEI